MAIIVRDLQDKVTLEKNFLTQLQHAAEKILQEENLSTDIEISLCFVDNQYIRDLNKQYRGKDQVTDVLSFPLEEDPLENISEEPEMLLGDIVISLERAREQAEDAGHSINQEVALLFAHGFLHLLSYHHQNEEEYNLMWNKMEKIMEIIGYHVYNSN